MSKKRTPKESKLHLQPRTDNQRKYFAAIHSCTVTICTGPPGSGKTLIACGLAAKALLEGEVNRIIVARPLVACGFNRIGILPGELDEKLGPWMRPVVDKFAQFIDPMKLNGFWGNKTIEICPLEMMRGEDYKDTFVILDEGQNAEYEQLKMFLTRFAEGSKVVITGDVTQTDLKYRGENPLAKVQRKLSGHHDIARVELDRGDIFRHPLTQWIDERLNEGDRGGVDVYDQDGEQIWPERKWEKGTCPSCRVDFRYSTIDEKDRETVQVQCYRCRSILWTPDPSEGEVAFSLADMKMNCLPTRKVRKE